MDWLQSHAACTEGAVPFTQPVLKTRLSPSRQLETVDRLNGNWAV